MEIFRMNLVWYLLYSFICDWPSPQLHVELTSMQYFLLIYQDVNLYQDLVIFPILVLWQCSDLGTYVFFMHRWSVHFMILLKLLFTIFVSKF